MAGDVAIHDPELSDGASDVGESEREQEHEQHDSDTIDPQDDHNPPMAEQKFSPEVDENGKAGSATAKPKYDPKDPLRPRRKKARRACFACQRAHLTCGDERPCQRCIKRGLADACQDGVRKKAKYLHDAPPEALRPVLGPSFNQINHRHNGSPIGAVEMSPARTYFTQADSAPSYPVYSSQMPPPIQSRVSYSSQQSPISPAYQTSGNSQPDLQGLPVSQQPHDQNAFSNAMFDLNNPAFLNFDPADLRFDNHYGALEFTMLERMASTTRSGDHVSMQHHSANEYSFNDGSVFNPDVGQYGQMYPQEILPDYVGMGPQNAGVVYPGNIMPHAYSIGNGPATRTSPSTDASPTVSAMGFDNSSTTSYDTTQSTPQPVMKRPGSKSGSNARSASATVLGKRARDPSSIYETVHEPYSYTAGFHRLTEFVQRRFSPNKTLRIAKSLASIRPSFIACTKNLTHEDLIFMEKCFQRTLFEYNILMLQCCTPTLVCRRTGEVAAVNKEFTLLTGWTKDNLLGSEPNLNVNMGQNGEEKASSQSSGSLPPLSTRMRPLSAAEAQNSEGNLQAVFLAELLDDDSVIEFYDEFAKLAFGDARGSVMARCKVLKYQTKETLAAEGLTTQFEGRNIRSGDKGKLAEGQFGTDGVGNKVKEIDGEYGIVKLEKNGKLDCCYCWTVKRDPFDIPMTIVVNFLPCI